jgi:hypothetical protein
LCVFLTVSTLTQGISSFLLFSYSIFKMLAEVADSPRGMLK